MTNDSTDDANNTPDTRPALVKGSLIVEVVAEFAIAQRLPQLRAFIQKKGITEDGTFIVDLIAALVAAGRTDELRSIVENAGLEARLDFSAAIELKKFLARETVQPGAEGFRAARRARQSEEPCGRG